MPMVRNLFWLNNRKDNRYAWLSKPQTKRVKPALAQENLFTRLTLCLTLFLKYIVIISTRYHYFIS